MTTCMSVNLKIELLIFLLWPSAQHAFRNIVARNALQYVMKFIWSELKMLRKYCGMLMMIWKSLRNGKIRGVENNFLIIKQKNISLLFTDGQWRLLQAQIVIFILSVETLGKRINFLQMHCHKSICCWTDWHVFDINCQAAAVIGWSLECVLLGTCFLATVLEGLGLLYRMISLHRSYFCCYDFDESRAHDKWCYFCHNTSLWLFML